MWPQQDGGSVLPTAWHRTVSTDVSTLAGRLRLPDESGAKRGVGKSACMTTVPQ